MWGWSDLQEQRVHIQAVAKTLSRLCAASAKHPPHTRDCAACYSFPFNEELLTMSILREGQRP